MIYIEKPEFAIFTVCNLAYFPKALALAGSVLKNDGIKLKIYLCDKKINLDFSRINADVIWIEDCGISDIYELAFKYDITEFSTSLKPLLTIALLEEYAKVVFLDPDTFLYGSIEPVLKDLDLHSVVLTPHFITPHIDGDIGMMRFGSFNLGFYAVKNSEQGLYFLNWWSERCLQHCFFETQFGLSTDQKWISIAPCFFNDLHVSFHLGYNMAFWNIHERVLCENSEGKYIVNDKYPLIFFHFSSFDESSPESISKRPFLNKDIKRHDLVRILNEYNDELQRNKFDKFRVKYGFDYMSNGDYISPTLRRAYASVVREMPVSHNPFDSHGIVGAFARKNHLIEKSEKTYTSVGFKDSNDHKIAFFIINKFLRALLILLGPNRFQNLSTLMIYLSSYRLNRKLWKY